MNPYRILTLSLIVLFSSNALSEQGTKYRLLTNISLTADHSKGGAVTQGKLNSELKNLKKGDEVELNIEDDRVNFKIRSVSKDDNKLSFSGFGTSITDFITIAENSGKTVGSIQTLGKLYKIRPGLNGGVIITEVSKSNLVDHDNNYFEILDAGLEEDFSGITTKAETSDSGEQISVIVAYTNRFKVDAGDVTAYMDLLEEETNVSYANSQINTTVKIVHAYETSYAGSGSFATDLDFFSNSNNTETAELLQLREVYNADVMILLTGNDGYATSCGRAKVIGATEANALAAAREGCAAGYFSFGHEIGHLIGARHIISQDPNTEPFSYGHGYCNTTPQTWRTVMAYNCPSNSGGGRIQQWSSPDVFINGEVTGSANIEDNARVLNERALEVANFRVSENPQNYSWMVPIVSLILQ